MKTLLLAGPLGGLRRAWAGACLGGWLAIAILSIAAPVQAQLPPGALTEPGDPAPVVAATAHLPRLDDIDPVRFDYAQAIDEYYFIATRTGTPLNSGNDLLPDDGRIWVDVIRPDTEEPVPIILIASPYYNTLGRGWRGEGKAPEAGGVDAPVPGVLTGFPFAVPYPEWYDEYFVPRGYAVALMDLRGTRNSTGCQVYGDRDEVLDVVDVIDHLVEQPWSNGKVGMTGGSYDGTVAIGAADEMVASGRHPEALAAIIPIRAIGRWYDYHFFNGVQSSGHAATPALFAGVLAAEDLQNTPLEDDLLLPLHIAQRKACIPTVGAATVAGYASPYQDTSQPFWVERDFTQHLALWQAAPFFIHGLFDFNVKTHTTAYVWEQLPANLPRMIWWADMDHADPHIPTVEDQGSHQMPFPYRPKFIDATHRWYLQHLKNVEAGALALPVAQVQDFGGDWLLSDHWPVAETEMVLGFSADGTATAGEPMSGSAGWSDVAAGSGSAMFVSAPLETDIRVSGQIAFELELTASGADTTVAVEIAVLAPGTADDLSVPQISPARRKPEGFVLQYAWARAFYRDSIAASGVSSPVAGSPLTPATPFGLAFAASHTDTVLPAGHRLRFRFAPALGGTVAGGIGGNVEMALGAGKSRVRVPIAAAPVAAAASQQRNAPEPGLTAGGALGLILALLPLAGWRQGRHRSARGPSGSIGGSTAPMASIPLAGGLALRARPIRRVRI